MTRRCTCCGATFAWHTAERIFDGHNPDNVFFGLELRNHVCGGTLAEPAGLAWAATQVPRVDAVRIDSVRP